MSGWGAYQDHVWAQESAERLKRRISELEHERDRYREALEQIASDEFSYKFGHEFATEALSPTERAEASRS